MDHAMVYMLLLQVIVGDLVPPDDTLWRQLPAIGVMCPGRNICPEARALNFSEADTNSDIGGCCAECSCDPLCTDHGNCCFQRMDTIRERNDQECHYETLLHPTYVEEPIKSYYMVAKEPKGGCVANFVLDSANRDSCCEVDVAPWGSFLPVWSPSKGRIYKNRLYAECHGAIDYIMWGVSQMCKEVKEADSDLTGCNILFTFPGTKEELKTEQCFTDFYGTCPDEFVVKPGVQYISKQEIRDGCQSDFRLSYDAMDHLKNVYCYICTKSPYVMPARHCTPLGGRNMFGQYLFTSLLSRDYLTEYRPHQNKIPDQACEMVHGTVLVETCRPVYCPTGRTFSVVDGRCTFASQSWNIGDMQILIHLTFDHPNETLTYSAVRDLVNSGSSFDVPKKWAMAYAYIPIFDNVSLISDWEDDLLKTIHESTLQRPAKELLLSLYPKYKTGDPSKLMKFIQALLSKKWTVSLGGIRIEASARLSNPRLNIFGAVNGIGYIYYPEFMAAKDDNGSMIYNESNVFLEVIRRDGMKVNTYVINKLYFCQQIELESHEFVLYSETDPLGLLRVRDNKYFIGSEFNLRRKTGGNATARICLQDAGYHILPQTSTARRLQACVYVLPLLIFLRRTVSYR